MAPAPRVRVRPCIQPVFSGSLSDWKGSIGDNTMQFWNDDSIRSVAATPNSHGHSKFIVVYNEPPCFCRRIRREQCKNNGRAAADAHLLQNRFFTKRIRFS
jgi:hypothetical protein